MIPSQAPPSPGLDDPRVSQAVEEYLAALDAGRQPDRREFLARHADIAAALEKCLDGLDFIRSAAPQILSPGQPPSSPEGELQPEGPLGDFRIVREVGRGGMGVVYEAVQISMGRRVALKVLPFAAVMDPRHLQRFKNEARAAGSLQHPHIVPVHFVGSERGVHYFAMQFIEGQTLAALIQQLRQAAVPEEKTTAYSPPDGAGKPDAATEPAARQSTLTASVSPKSRDYFRRVAEWGEQAAEALEHAHQTGIVHRDVKPGNLMIDTHGHLWVTDFGLAHVQQGEASLTMTGDLIGTLRYMSPEQALAKRVLIDHRTDVYSLGVTLYELLTLEPAFAGTDRQEVLRQIAFEEPKPPRRRNRAVPAELETIVLKSLEKNPADRYTTAKELAEDLRRFLDNKPIRARRPSLGQVVLKWARRHRTLVTVVAVALLAGTATSTYFAIDAVGQANAARESAAKAQAKEKLARENAAETRRVLGEFSIANGVRLEEQGDLLGAMLWYAEPLRRDPDNTEAVATTRLRLTAYRRYAGLPTLVQVFTQTSGVNYAEFSPDGRRVFTAGGREARVWDAATGRPVSPALAHDGEVTYAAFSPDGRRVITVSDDKTARVWDAATGQPLTPLLQHQSQVWRAEFSPDGRRVFVSGSKTRQLWDVTTGQSLTSVANQVGLNWIVFSPDWRRVLTIDWGKAQIWDEATGQPLAPPLQHQYQVTQAAFSPDGRRVFTASGREVRVWDTVTGMPLTPPLQHQDRVLYAAFSPDGRRVITVSDDKTARVWDAATGRPVSSALAHQGEVTYAAFSPDGQRVVTASADKTARVWDAATGKPATTPLTHRGKLTYAAFSPACRRVLTTMEDGLARVWDAATGKPLTPPLQHNGRKKAAFSPDGRRFLTLSEGEARVWDAAAGQPVTPPLVHQDMVVRAAFSPDGRNVLTTSSNSLAVRAGSAQVWDATTGKPLTPPLPHQLVMHEAFSPDGRRVLTAGAGIDAQGNPCGEARVWDAATGQPLTPPLQHRSLVWRAVFSADGRHVLTTSEEIHGDGKTRGEARVWDAVTGKPLTPLLQHQVEKWTGGASLTQATFSPDGRRVLTASYDGIARLWDAATGQPVSPLLQHKGCVNHSAFSPDGRHVLTANWRRDEEDTILSWGEVRIWEATTGVPVTPSLDHRHTVTQAAFSPDGRRVFTASGREVRVWDTVTGMPLTPPLQHQDQVTQAAFSPDGRRVFTASGREVRVWDTVTGMPLTPLLQHQDQVTQAAFSPDGRRVFTASGREVRVWDTVTGMPLTPPLQHQDIVLYAAFSPDGRRVITASADKSAKIWDLTPDDRPLEDWLTLAQLGRGCRIDDTGALIPLTPEEITHRWQQLRQRYPQEFTVPAQQAFAWHRREMEECIWERNPATAVFHAWHAFPGFHLLWGAFRP
jgi:WD40 repeat protein/serine/threonine protein kinase